MCVHTRARVRPFLCRWQAAESELSSWEASVGGRVQALLAVLSVP